MEVNTPSSADRRPAREDPPPRRMRATAPAHSNPECAEPDFVEFATLIKRILPEGRCVLDFMAARPNNPLRREGAPESIRPWLRRGADDRMTAVTLHREGPGLRFLAARNAGTAGKYAASPKLAIQRRRVPLSSEQARQGIYPTHPE
jgi:hypothetical protein